MSAHVTSPHRRNQSSYSQSHSSPPNQPQFDDDDVKAPYDDLIDQYAAPYGVNPQHKTFNIATGRTGAAPTYPLTHKQTNNSDDDSGKDIEASTTEGTDWGYPPGPPTVDKEKKTFWATIIPDSIACRLYLLTVLVETSIDLAIEADLYIRFKEVDIQQPNATSQNKMPVYLALFALAHVFQFGMALDAVYARNTLQFMFLTVFNAILLAYSVIQISEVNGLIPLNTPGISHIPINDLTKIIPIVVAVAECAYMGLGYKIYTEFGWQVYKYLGADRRIKSMYAQYQVFLCLVKFDLFFWVSFSIQFIWLVLSHGDAEYYLTCAALPISILVLVEGHLAARYESRWMMITFMGGCAAAMIYFTYKLVKVLRFRETDTFILVWKTMTCFSVLAILLLIATVISTILVMRNFGRGLKTQMQKNKPGLQRGKSQYVHKGPMTTHPNRMSID
ncbi:hypothetical protein EUX98_g7531 [Antrodiella citrinella]|uniref:TRP C-terminal domain-containing protein n=1 Tax=Antrodiella citrinella TaxID=2447956 RepID=A0A4S4MLA6_9APHY|nr:hypothetical protein EUX98_g7531 [Antrodiella citrinella]